MNSPDPARAQIMLKGDLGLADPYPAAMLEGSLLFADLHIGMEEGAEAIGVHVPYPVSSDVRAMVMGAISDYAPRELWLLGDLKHELSTGLRTEFEEVARLVMDVERMGVKVSLVRGNHDNFIAPILEELGVGVFQKVAKVDGRCLIHGHLDIDPAEEGCDLVVMGHEHPAVSIKDDAGIRHVIRAFLWGRAEGADVLVLPSPNPLVQGVPANEVEREDLLSPLLRRSDLDSFFAYAVEPGVGIVPLATVGALRRILAG